MVVMISRHPPPLVPSRTLLLASPCVYIPRGLFTNHFECIPPATVIYQMQTGAGTRWCTLSVVTMITRTIITRGPDSSITVTYHLNNQRFKRERGAARGERIPDWNCLLRVSVWRRSSSAALINLGVTLCHTSHSRRRWSRSWKASSHFVLFSGFCPNLVT